MPRVTACRPRGESASAAGAGVFACGGRTVAARPGVFFVREGSPESPGRSEHLGFTHLCPLHRRARQLDQRPPHQSLAYLGTAGGQRPLSLALLQHLAHQGPRRASVRLLRNQGPRHPRPGGRRRVRPVLVRVPVQEGEVEEARLPQRPPRQFPPEGEEGLGEVHPRLAVPQQEGHLRPVTQLLLGEVAHRQRQSPLATVVSVQRAHRHAHGLCQPCGLHVVVPPPCQQPRRVTHGIGVHHLQKVHTPSPSRPLGHGLLRTRRLCASSVPHATGCRERDVLPLPPSSCDGLP